MSAARYPGPPRTLPDQAASEMRVLASEAVGASMTRSAGRSPSRQVADFLAYRLRKWAAAIAARDRPLVEAAWEAVCSVNWKGDAEERRIYLEAGRLLRVALETL